MKKISILLLAVLFTTGCAHQSELTPEYRIPSLSVDQNDDVLWALQIKGKQIYNTLQYMSPEDRAIEMSILKSKIGGGHLQNVLMRFGINIDDVEAWIINNEEKDYVYGVYGLTNDYMQKGFNNTLKITLSESLQDQDGIDYINSVEMVMLSPSLVALKVKKCH